MIRTIVFIAMLCISLSVNAEVWINDKWNDDFYTSIWKDCIDKNYKASGHMEKHGVISGISLKESQDPTLVMIKDYCDCTATYFQKNYSKNELEEILGGDQSSPKLAKLNQGFSDKCKNQ